MVTTTEGRESPRVAHRFLVPRLSLMMFMQFFIWGSWSVTLGLVMTRYEMSLLIGDAFSAGPIASILSPFVLGMLVDRFFASQKVMAVMHLAGAVILWFVPQALVAQNGALLIVLSLTVSCRYIWWRYTSTLNWDDPVSLVCGLILLFAETYAWIVLVLGYFQVVWPLNRQPVPLPKDMSL